MLPVVETDMENMTNLIPTNVMSMTDGHILFLSTLHAEGRYPAADASKSVTRVGKQTQMLIHKVLADKTMALLTEYAELERFSRFGSDLAEETQRTIKRGKVMQELISQPMGVFIEAEYQILLLGLVFAGYFDNKDIPFVHTKKMEIVDFLRKTSTFTVVAGKIKEYKFPDLVTLLEKAKDEVEKGIIFVAKKEVGSDGSSDTSTTEPEKSANAPSNQSKIDQVKDEKSTQEAKVPEVSASSPPLPSPGAAKESTGSPLPPSGEVPQVPPAPPPAPPQDGPKKSRAFFSILGRKKKYVGP
jgi:hypothetical protein